MAEAGDEPRNKYYIKMILKIMFYMGMVGLVVYFGAFKSVSIDSWRLVPVVFLAVVE